MKKETTISLHVKNMSCLSCEEKIKNELLKYESIINVTGNFEKSNVIINYYIDEISKEEIFKILKNINYPIKIKNKKFDFIKSILVLILIITLYLILDKNNIFNLFPLADEKTSMPMLIVIGLFTSIHCVAMCGGINISQSTIVNNNKLKSNLSYNLGRVIAYTIVGGIVGALGSIITPSFEIKGLITIIAGILMVLMGLSILGFFKKIIRIFPKIKISKKSNTPFVIGLLNGFMPCGPLQAMQLYALSTGSFILGALSMFLFSLGTVPLMFSLGVLSSYLSFKFMNIMMNVSGILVIMLGFMMFQNGLALAGFNQLF